MEKRLVEVAQCLWSALRLCVSIINVELLSHTVLANMCQGLGWLYIGAFRWWAKVFHKGESDLVNGAGKAQVFLKKLRQVVWEGSSWLELGTRPIDKSGHVYLQIGDVVWKCPCTLLAERWQTLIPCSVKWKNIRTVFWHGFISMVYQPDRSLARQNDCIVCWKTLD